MEKFLTNKKVLVTGSKGYVGKATEKLLLESGYQVIGFDKENSRDVRNIIKLLYFLSKNPKAIVHLSAKKSIPESIKNPGSYYLNNTLSTLSVALASRIFKVPVVFASSAAVYNSYNPYAKSKLIEEKILKIICKKVAILRYFNIVGKSEGISDRQGSNIFSIINKNPNIRINSTESTRDYVHILDIAKANVLAVEYLQNNDYILTDIFTGSQVTMVDVVDEYRANGIIVEYTVLNLPDLTVLPKIDNRNLLGWSPSYNFSDGVRSEVIF
jgi:nucleoside-diphosphate-sugar epimerase